MPNLKGVEESVESEREAGAVVAAATTVAWLRAGGVLVLEREELAAAKQAKLVQNG